MPRHLPRRRLEHTRHLRFNGVSVCSLTNCLFYVFLPVANLPAQKMLEWNESSLVETC